MNSDERSISKTESRDSSRQPTRSQQTPFPEDTEYAEDHPSNWTLWPKAEGAGGSLSVWS